MRSSAGARSKVTTKSRLDRLEKRRCEALAFVRDLQVPFDNNLAERHLCRAKARQPISGCLRSAEGANAFCRIRVCLSTARKQGGNVLAVRESALRGPLMHPDPARRS